ncbi:putative RING-H2 finger protein ATL12 [Triticum dicoccoides]|uniref:putative RING-H2 finger protein ATL12 n=1 Tax=Triticum dicoccoides TaxID=85692 RepID=UPI00162BD805|nr:putative RING-H2 finger protein ATL12 [Triticum dicoccoides]
MAKTMLLLLLCATIAAHAHAQAPTQPAAEETPPGAGVKVSFRPSVAIVVGIFTMIFSLTFLLLMYAKFCHPANTPLLPATTTASPSRAPAPDALIESEASAGVGKAVIESLPFFRFAALRGARQGLECAVCLARFDDADLLRLLPRCRHAFHLDCVDRWLHSSASCPLCRARVHPDDADLGLKYAAASARFVFGAGDDAAAVGAAPAPSSGRDLLAGIFVERVPSARFGGIGDAGAGDDAGAADESNSKLDRHRHRIVVSDSVFKSRWSDLNSADLIALDTEMLRSVSSGRFPYPYPDDDIIFLGDEPPEERGHRDDHDGAGVSIEIERKRLLDVESGSGSKAAPSLVRGLGGCGGSDAVEPSSVRAASRLVSSGVRSMSEIVRLPRVAVRTEEEERARQRWVPIARRTARWLASRSRSREEDVNAADRLRV